MVAHSITSSYGRVQSAKDGKVTVGYDWISKVKSKEFDAADVLKIHGKKRFGQPVAYKQGKDWHVGTVLHKGKDKVWVLAFAGRTKQIAKGDIQPMNVSRFKKGDKVWASWAGRLKPAEVIGVIEKGVLYKVKFEKLGEQTLPFAKVTSPIK
jgi:hypothetical protein